MGKRFFCTIAFCALVCCCEVKADEFINPAVIAPAGTINTHDMETLKRFEQEKQEQKDFQDYQRNIEKKEKVKKKKRLKLKLKKQI